MTEMVKHLENVYQDRCRRNAQYSLRAFARSLEIPVSSLSEILNRKRPMSAKLQQKIGTALKLSPEQIQLFIGRTQMSAKEVDYRQLALDSFYIISEWYHYGILQLLKTKGFKPNPKWIAARLLIDETQVAEAIERLLRVGILEWGSTGNLVDVTGGNTSHLKSQFTNEQLRQFQIKALENAILSLKTVPIEHRDNTSMTLAISKKALPFAKEEIKKFRRELTKKLEDFAEPDEVYQLAISLSPLTEIEP